MQPNQNPDNSPARDPNREPKASPVNPLSGASLFGDKADTHRELTAHEKISQRFQSWGALDLKRAEHACELPEHERVCACDSSGAFLVLLDESQSGPKYRGALRIVASNACDKHNQPIEIGRGALPRGDGELLQIIAFAGGQQLLILEGIMNTPGQYMQGKGRFKTDISIYTKSAGGSQFRKSSELRSELYSPRAVLGISNNELFIRGKRLSRLWQMLRGVDGSAVVERWHLNVPSAGAEVLRDDNYWMQKEDPLFSNALSTHPRNEFSLSGKLGGLDLLPLRKSAANLTLDRNALSRLLPDNARVHDLCFNAQGDKVALAYSRKQQPPGEHALLVCDLRIRGSVVVLESPLEIALPRGSRVESVQFTPDGRNLAAVVGAGTLLFDSQSGSNRGFCAMKLCGFTPGRHPIVAADNWIACLSPC